VGDRRSVERHGGGNRVLLSASRWWCMIIDWKGGAEVRPWESRQERCPGEFEVSKSQVRASWHVESASSL
jgi:hypothetical protein